MKEKKLWVEFDFSTHKLTAMELLKRMKYLNAETKTFKIRGMASKYPFKGWDNSTITKNMLTILNDNCPNLESFLIVEGFIDFNKVIIFLAILLVIIVCFLIVITFCLNILSVKHPKLPTISHHTGAEQV